MRFSKQSREEVQAKLVEKQSQQELSALISKVNFSTESSHAIISSILKLGEQEKLALTERLVQANMDFFQELFLKLAEELSEGNATLMQVIEAMQLAQVVNLDDEEIWTMLQNQAQRKLQGKVPILECFLLLKVLEGDAENLIEEKVKKNIEEVTEKQMVEQFKEGNVAELNNQQLTQNLSLLISHFGKKGCEDSNHPIISQVDTELSLRLQQRSLDPTNIANTCVMILQHNQDCEQGKEVVFESFLMALEEAIMQGVDGSSQYFQLGTMSAEEFIAVIGAFLVFGQLIQQMPELVQAFEQEVRNRIMRLSVENAIFILKLFAQGQEGSKDLYGLLDRFLGKNCDQIPTEMLAIVFQSFYEIGQARPKLFLKLQRRVTKAALSGELKLEDVCLILRIYSEISGQVDPYVLDPSEIPQAQAPQSSAGVSFSIFESLAKFVAANLEKMDQVDFSNAILAYKNVDLEGKRLGSGIRGEMKGLLWDLERILENNLQSLTLQTKASLLFTYSTPIDDLMHKKGSQCKYTKLLLVSIKSDLKQHDLVKSLGASEIFLLVFSFQRLQCPPEQYLPVNKVAEQSLHNFSDEHLHMLGQVYQDLAEKHEGFDTLLTAINDEIKTRREEL